MTPPAAADVIDPHAFQSIANAKIYVDNIADAFCTADPDGCGELPDQRRRLHREARRRSMPR